MSDARIDLRKCAFFQGLPTGPLKKLSAAARYRTCAAGEVLFRAGDAANRLYIVAEGSVEILTEKLESLQEREPVPTAMQSIGPDKILGWSALVPPHQYRFEARAAEATRLIDVDGEALRSVCGQDTDFGYAVLQRLIRLIVDRLHATKFQLSMHSGRPYSQAEGA